MVDLTFKILRFLIIFSIGVLFTGCENNFKKGEKLYHERKYQKALPLLEEQCIKGRSSACLMVASIYTQKDTPAHRIKTLKALHLACQYGDTPSCEISSRTYHTLGNRDLSLQALEWGCQGGNPKLCFKLALATIQSDHQDKKTKGKNPKYNSTSLQKALDLLIKSCYGGEKDACQMAVKVLRKNKLQSVIRIQDLTKQIEKLKQ